MELREKIIREIGACTRCGITLGGVIADRILAMPEIRGALAHSALLAGERKIFDNYRADLGRFLKPDGRIG